ncbi:hypothetical protein MycrhDRAFT_5025 [Mycolicibacterium rhodesiae JS60]|nr:hypothetical protein MycrhDRAFT_5025 [Mycolicibacterium rhodesiae JS60]
MPVHRERRTINDMNTGHLIGYVGGLAVALGVGTAVWLGTPTASADASSPSAHSASAGTAKSARGPRHTNTVGSIRRVPTHTNDAASGTTDPRRTKAAAATPATPNDLNIVYDQVTDNTSVTVVDSATNSPVGSTVTLDGSAGTPVLSSDGKRALITTTFHNPATDKIDTSAVVMNMTVGGQIGNTLGYSDASPMFTSFAPDGTRAVVTLFLASTSRIWVATLDTTTGTQTGVVNLGGYPFVAPVWNANGTRVLITVSQLGGTSTAVTVLDATTGDVAGTISIQGYAESAPTVTTGGTRAIVTTTIQGPDNWPSTRVTVVNTTDGSLAGNAVTFPGTAKISLLGDGRTAVIRTSSGFVSILDTSTATASPALPLIPPWGLDLLWRTPLGGALAPVLFVAGFLGSAILAFYVLPALLVIPAWIGEIVRQFPPITISAPW